MLQFAAERVPGVVYIAPVGNHAYLGPAPLLDIARQIRASHGPSGSNAAYLHELARALRELDADDPHVFELDRLVKALDDHGHQPAA
jgi:cation transport protein ChaC